MTTTIAVLSCNGRNTAQSTREIEDEVEEREAAASGACGVERWAVKTGTDAAARNVATSTPVLTDIGKLRAQSVPSGLNRNSGRTGQTESTAWVLKNVTLSGYKLEGDHDYHLVIQGPAGTMIAEIPDPACIGAQSPWKSAIANVRQAFNAKVGAPGTSLTRVNTTVSLMGVGFFDMIHGQTGVAPNGIELHPVLSMCFGSNCSI